REGSRHSIYLNPANGKKTSVPRHMEIDNAWRAKSANSSMFRQSARESAPRRLCLVTARDGSCHWSMFSIYCATQPEPAPLFRLFRLETCGTWRRGRDPRGGSHEQPSSSI